MIAFVNEDSPRSSHFASEKRQWRSVVTYSWRYLCSVPLTQLRNWKSSHVFPNHISTDQVYTKSEFLREVRMYCHRQSNRWDRWAKFTRSLAVCRLHFRYSSCPLKLETLYLTSYSVVPSNCFLKRTNNSRGYPKHQKFFPFHAIYVFVQWVSYNKQLLFPYQLSVNGYYNEDAGFCYLRTGSWYVM